MVAEGVHLLHLWQLVELKLTGRGGEGRGGGGGGGGRRGAFTLFLSGIVTSERPSQLAMKQAWLHTPATYRGGWGREEEWSGGGDGVVCNI